MQVDTCISNPSYDVGNKSNNGDNDHDISKKTVTPNQSDLLGSLQCRVEDLEQIVEDLRLDIKSTITCRVCYKNAPVDGFSQVNVLGCGHAFCSICALSMQNCAICKAVVVGKFKLFI